MKTLLTTTFLLLVFSIVGLSQDAEKESKEQKKERQYQQILDLVNSGSYEFTAQRANPQKAPTIDLTTRPNFLRIKEEIASADMPYFGRAFSGGYGSSGGIEFDAAMDTYDIQKNDKKRRLVIKFKVKGTDDTYSCILTISGMESASLTVSGNKRQGISYTGKMSAIKSDTE
ncbi:MAG: DUF4251 domain-containing protein [Cytophagales bacterium]|nr:DUF4251 domain-containing protein [Cytophagales bacterium]